MKKLMIMLAMALICSIAMAQSETTRTIHGAVVDKNGNPLPGAVVSATEGAETALVNADGTFELEIPIWLKSVTASYAGYNNKKMKPLFDRDMIFSLKPKNRHAFFNVFFGAAFPGGDADNGDGLSSTVCGLMGGLLDDWGCYGKVAYLPTDKTIQISAGATKCIYGNIYAYLGLGYGKINEWYNLNMNYPGYRDWKTENGIAFEGGFIFRIGKHFDITAGYTHVIDFDAYGWYCIPNVSVGYVF